MDKILRTSSSVSLVIINYIRPSPWEQNIFDDENGIVLNPRRTRLLYLVCFPRKGSQEKKNETNKQTNKQNTYHVSISHQPMRNEEDEEQQQEQQQRGCRRAHCCPIMCWASIS